MKGTLFIRNSSEPDVTCSGEIPLSRRIRYRYVNNRFSVLQSSIVSTRKGICRTGRVRNVHSRCVRLCERSFYCVYSAKFAMPKRCVAANCLWEHYLRRCKFVSVPQRCRQTASVGETGAADSRSLGLPRRLQRQLRVVFGSFPGRLFRLCFVGETFGRVPHTAQARFVGL